MTRINRRQFVIAAAAATACRLPFGVPAARADSPAPAGDFDTPPQSGGDSVPVVDAGPLTDFPADQVYDQFREDGFFVIRRDRKVFAISSVCTHKGCKVRPQEDQSFFCKCHKSAFDPEGGVLKGPATRDLPRLAVRVDDRGHVLVDRGQQFQRKK